MYVQQFNNGQAATRPRKKKKRGLHTNTVLEKVHASIHQRWRGRIGTKKKKEEEEVIDRLAVIVTQKA